MNDLWAVDENWDLYIEGARDRNGVLLVVCELIPADGEGDSYDLADSCELDEAFAKMTRYPGEYMPRTLYECTERGGRPYLVIVEPDDLEASFWNAWVSEQFELIEERK